LSKTELRLDDKAISIVREAMEIAERTDPKNRIYVRAGIGHLLQQFVLAAEFGSYAADTIGVQEKLFRDRFPRDPEREAQSNKLQELEAEAKHRFLSGDLLDARDIYLSAEDLRDDHMRNGVLGAHVDFFGWKLEAGDLPGAVSLFESVDWETPWTRVAMARRLASAFIAAGQRSKALLILRKMRPSPDADDSHKTLSYMGQALWSVGETAEAKAVLREAAKASLSAVARNVRLPLWGYSSSEPLSVARIQCAISDRDGAAETLNELLKLEPPLEYEPPRSPPPADSVRRRIYITGPPMLKPAAKRWVEAQPELVRMLARAGLDADATSFLAAPNAKQLDLLGRILRGDAERGSFAAAFQILERLRNDALMTEAEPSKVSFKPNGEIVVYTQQSPVRPVEDLERKAAVKDGVWHIMHNAARLGDVDAFKRAEILRQQEVADGSAPVRDFNELRMLARAGCVEVALESARAVPSLDARVSALLRVVEGVARVPSSRDDSFYP
jgi:tetratricopeptide (TPR) repeat protein